MGTQSASTQHTHTHTHTHTHSLTNIHLHKGIITNHASRLVCRNDPDFKWPPHQCITRKTAQTQNGSNSAVDGLHV